MNAKDLDDLFSSYDCRCLLTDKRIVIMGDSSKKTGNDQLVHVNNIIDLLVQRSVYKDFVVFLQEDRLIDECELKRKVKEKYFVGMQIVQPCNFIRENFHTKTTP
jgi:hypothetical protein